MGQRIPPEAAPQAAPQEGAPAPEQGGENQLTGLIQNLAKGFQIFSETIAGINPQLGQEAQALMAGFEGLVDKLSGGGQPQADQGMATPEQGASGAQPLQP